MGSQSLVFGYLPSNQPDLLSEFQLEPSEEPMLIVAHSETRFQHVLRGPIELQATTRFLKCFCPAQDEVNVACEESLQWNVGHPPAGTAIVLLLLEDEEPPPWFSAAAARVRQQVSQGYNSLQFVVIHR